MKGDKRKCDECNRLGEVVYSEMMPAQKCFGIMEPWLFEYSRCRYHKGWETRRKNKNRL